MLGLNRQCKPRLLEPELQVYDVPMLHSQTKHSHVFASLQIWKIQLGLHCMIVFNITRNIMINKSRQCLDYLLSGWWSSEQCINDTFTGHFANHNISHTWSQGHAHSQSRTSRSKLKAYEEIKF